MIRQGDADVPAPVLLRLCSARRLARLMVRIARVFAGCLFIAAALAIGTSPFWFWFLV